MSFTIYHFIKFLLAENVFPVNMIMLRLSFRMLLSYLYCLFHNSIHKSSVRDE